MTGYGRCLKLDPAHPVHTLVAVLFGVGVASLFAVLIATSQIAPDQSLKRMSFSAIAKGWKDSRTPPWAKYALVGGAVLTVACLILAYVLFNLFGTWV